MEVKITIPGELPDMNQIIKMSKQHYGSYSRKKKIYTEEVAKACLSVKNKKISGKVAVTCEWMARNRRKDPDNISAGVKFILDGIVEAGILPNDGWSQVEKIDHYFKVDKRNPRVEVTIREVESIEEDAS